MTYSTARPLLYFSPDSYKVLEVFVHFGNDFNMKSKFVYHFEYTFGKQKVSTDPQINATRISAEMGYRFSDRIKLTGQYFYSTAANTTNKGFSFTRYTLKLSTVL